MESNSSTLNFGEKYSQLTLESSLCFPKDIFYALTFDVDAFLSHFKREYSLERLRDDLKVYLKVLEMSMCELINKDYPDFVNLSTNLVDLEKSIKNLKTPLETIKGEVDNVKGSIDKEIESVMSKLNEKLMIEKRRIVIKLLMNWQRSFKVTNEMIGNSNESKKITADHLERLAFEFCQLKTSLSICSGENKEAIAQNNDINKLSEMLEKILKEQFLGCFNLKDSSDSSMCANLSNEDTKKQMKHVLKSYSLLSKQKLAEQLYTDYVVKPYMNQYINENHLESNIHGLKGVLQVVLDFIDANHNFFILAHEIKTSSATSTTTSASTNGGEATTNELESSSNTEFEFILNSIFATIVNSLDLNLHSIFSPADPDQFHSYFNSAFAFLAEFETKCAQYDRDIKRKLVASQAYKYFVKKWPVHVYYQIRYQEIVVRFEEDLLLAGSNKQAELDDDERFLLKSTESLVKSMEYSWLESKCFLKCLLSHFWKLNLQLVSRYCYYYLKMFENKKTAAAEEETSGSAAPTNSQEAHKAFIRDQGQAKEHEDLSLCVMLINDVDRLVNQKLPNFFDGVIAPVMRSSNAVKEIPILKEAFNSSLTSLSQLQAFLIDFIVQKLTQKCLVHLKSTNDILRLYWRTNREVSKTASAYVSLTVEVINDFKQMHLSSDGQKSSTHQLELIEKCIQASIDSICLKYHSNASDLLESVRKMEDNLRMLQRVRKTNTAAATNAANTISDDDKIRMQLHLDVVEFGRLCAEKFNGYKGESNYDALLKLVEEAAAAGRGNNVNTTNSSSPSTINNTTTSTTTNNTPANDKTQSFMNQNSEIV